MRESNSASFYLPCWSWDYITKYEPYEADKIVPLNRYANVQNTFKLPTQAVICQKSSILHAIVIRGAVIITLDFCDIIHGFLLSPVSWLVYML